MGIQIKRSGLKEYPCSKVFSSGVTSRGKLLFNFIYSSCLLNLVLGTYESKKNVEFDIIPNNPHEKYTNNPHEKYPNNPHEKYTNNPHEKYTNNPHEKYTNNPHEKYPKSNPANVDLEENIKESVAKRLRRKKKVNNHENETPLSTNLESNIDLAETSLQLTTTKSIIDETSSKRESKTHEEMIHDYQEPNLISCEK